VNETSTTATIDHLAGSSNFTARLATFARAHRAQIGLALAFALYLGFAFYLTWPLVTNISHSIYGAPGDPYGTMAFFGNLVAHHQNPFLPGRVTQFAAPEGLPIPWPRDLASAPEILTLYLLTAVFGEISAYGIYTLLGYTLTGIATFLLARQLTKNTWAALIAGWAFAFYPFAALNGQGHLDFVQGWVLIFALWRMLELQWHPTRRNGLLAGLAVALGIWWSPYFIVFVGVTYVAVTVVALLVAWRARRLRSVLAPQMVSAVIILAFLAGLALLSTVGSGEGIGVRTHNTYELTAYGARPLEYILPDIESPLFGSTTNGYLKTLPQGGRGIETTLYVGATIMLLALVALTALIRRKLTPKLNMAVLSLSLVAVAAIVTSMPPEAHIFGVLIPFPSHFISLITTTWRVYSRFVMVVMLALSLLAAVGLDALTRGRSPRLKIAVMLLATIAIPLDLWTPQGGHVSTIPSPGIYKTLARLPTGLTIEYPLAESSVNAYKDIFFQGNFNKPIVSGYVEGTYQEWRALSLSVLAEPSTASRLATLGVRYVIVDSSPPNWGNWPEPGTPGAGFRLIASEPYAKLYAVTARPSSPALAATGEGFGNARLTANGVTSWLEQPTGTIELEGVCTTCKGVLKITLASFAQHRHVEIFNSGGHVLAQGPVNGNISVSVSIPLHFTKHMTLFVRSTPGLQRVSKEEGSPSISVQIIDPEFVGVGSAAGATTPATSKQGGAS
jgi:hypothetical protein